MKKKDKQRESAPGAAVQTAVRRDEHFAAFGPFPRPSGGLALFRELRRSVPVIGAAIEKLNRLIGSFEVKTGCERTDAMLKSFLASVPVGAGREGVQAFVSTFFTQLLTYGTAVGEIVVEDGEIACLLNADLNDVALSRGNSPAQTVISARDASGRFCPVPRPELITVALLDPEPGEVYGRSILEGLPFVADVLMKIFAATGSNWERMGNVRYCVTYKPQDDPADRAFAQQRIKAVAEEWSRTVNSSGAVKDFVALGDVEIKAIGADNQIPDSEVPVRQLLEQIVAKLGVPPFLLGLSWSATERMSSQQADILTSELEAYRRTLEPVISRIVRVFLASAGLETEHEIVWDDITLQDIETLAKTDLLRAQAAALAEENEEGRNTD